MKRCYWIIIIIIVASVSFFGGIIIGNKSDKNSDQNYTITPTTDIDGWRSKKFNVEYNPFDVALKIQDDDITFIFYKEQENWEELK